MWEEDIFFIILPNEEDDTTSRHIRDKNISPKHHIIWRTLYLESEKYYSFSAMNSRNNKKTIRASIHVEANGNIASIIEEIAFGLQTDERVAMRIKGVKLMQTSSDYCLFGFANYCIT